MNKTAKKARAAEFLAKANKHLGWLTPFLAEMRAHGKSGRFDEFERILHVSLALVASIHEAIADAAKCAGHMSWHGDLIRTRRSDPLLYYLWKARDAETHDTLVKWEEGFEAEVVIVDDKKANTLIASFGDLAPHPMTVKLFHYLFGATSDRDFADKVRDGAMPSAELLEASGVRLERAVNTFVFNDFNVREEGKTKLVQAPRSHGAEAMIPTAFSTIQRARLYYTKKSAELASLA
jgi:hypothetical protein